MEAKRIILLTLLMARLMSTYAVTNVSGTYFINTTWNLSGSPYLVNGDLQVATGVTLTIEQGVQVYFSGNYEILVKGALIVSAFSSSAPVNFESGGSGKSMLIFKSANLNSSSLNHVNFTGGRNGVELGDDVTKNTGTLLLRNCTFTRSSVYTSGNVTSAGMVLDSCSFYLSTIQGNATQSEPIDIRRSNINRCVVTSESNNKGITLTLCVTDSSQFKLGCCGSRIRVVAGILKHSRTLSPGAFGIFDLFDCMVESCVLNLPEAHVNIIGSDIVHDTLNALVIGEGIVECSRITGNGLGTGLVLSGSFNGNGNSSLSMRNSIVQQNNLGIDINGTAGLEKPAYQLAIDSSAFINNSGINIRNSTTKEVLALHNYWGANDSVAIRNKLADYYTNINYGKILYSNWLAAVYYSSRCQGPKDTGSCNTSFTALFGATDPRATTFVPLASNNGSVFITWDFGDSVFNQDYISSHTFQSYGPYTVCMSTVKYIAGAFACSNKTCTQLYIPNSNCAAAFSFAKDETSPGKINFSNLSGNPQLFTYKWSFNDLKNSTSNLVNPAFQFAYIGNYNVCLTVISKIDSTCGSTVCKTVNVSSVGACKAGITYLRDSINPKRIHFSSNSVGDSLWTWNFGDTSESGLRNPEHVFKDTTPYTVCLTIRNPATGCFSTTCVPVIPGLPQAGCDAGFLGTGTPNFVPLATKASLTFNWHFGDGTTSTSKFAVHPYQYGGTYTVCLYVEDSIDKSCNNRVCKSVFIEPAKALTKCYAGFEYQAISPRVLEFHSLAGYRDDSVSYFWAFGDGDSATAPNPSHPFAANGDYNVCLFVSAPLFNCFKTHCAQVHVKDSASTALAQAGSVFDNTKVYPNPFYDVITIDLPGTEAGLLEAALCDLQGRMVCSNTYPVHEGMNSYSIETGSLPQGIYLLKLESRGTHFYKKLTR